MSTVPWRWAELFQQKKKHTANNSCHSRAKKLCHLQKANSVCHPARKRWGNLCFLLSSMHIKQRERCWEDIRQQTWRQVKKPVWSSINYARALSNQWIHSVNAHGRWTNTCRLSGAERESDLFSKLVCLISPACCWKAEHAAVIFQMQEISNNFMACEIGLHELNPLGLWLFSPQNEDKRVWV